MTADATTRIPQEWSDPRHVMPHLAKQLEDWRGVLHQVDEDLGVVQGALDPGDEPVNTKQVLEYITMIRGRVEHLRHEVSGRTTSFRLIADELTRA